MKCILLIDNDEDDREFFLNAADTIDPSIACEIAWNGKVAMETLVVLSASSDQATVSEVMDLGARYFITKPNKLSLLELELRKLFEKKML